MIVGLSISASPDLAALGFGNEHLRAVMIEVAQHLLVAGHDLAYGGDLRPGGFTFDLAELVRAYVPVDEDAARLRIRSYLAWPIHLHSPANELADLQTVGTLKQVDAPPEAASEGETPFAKARGLNEMRRLMADQIGARIALGGKTFGYSGLLPGIAEEVLLMLEAGKPVYLLGAFGGCTRLIVQALRSGVLPPGLTPERVDGESDPELGRRIELAKSYADRAPDRPNYDRLRTALSKGMSALCARNGLTVEENELLFTSPDDQLLLALVLKGLASIGGGV